MFIDLPALRHKLRKVEAPYSVYNGFKSEQSSKIIIKTRVIRNQDDNNTYYIYDFISI